jgi:ERCC4-type nuclease
MTIIIDTREQNAWSFTGLADVRKEKLDAGDYALDGDHGFAIERKSLPDLIGTIAGKADQWERFGRELDRMAASAFPARVVIVEASYAAVLAGDYPSNVKPVFVMKRLAELTLQGVAVLFADNGVSAAGLAYMILRTREQQLEG